MESVIVTVNKKHFIIDKEDLVIFNNYKWTHFLNREEGSYYLRMVKNNKQPKAIYYHRLILNLNDPKIQVDHINRNSQDNRKENLRICPKGAFNAINRPKQKNNTSEYKGVFLRKDKYYKDKITYRAAIRVEQKLIHLGHFDSAIDAAKAYNKAAIEHFGDWAYLNKV